MTAVRIGVILIAYLLGTFPTAQLVGRRAGFDPTAEGSGNPGASNTVRVGGWKAGATVLAGDLVKGMLACGIAYAIDGRSLAWFAGAAAIAGHMWPVTRQLQGGKGVATALGVGLVCAPIASIVLLGLFGVIVRLTHKAAVGSIAIAALLPAAVTISGQEAYEVAVAGLIGLAIIVRHQTNIRRLLGGTEAAVTDG